LNLETPPRGWRRLALDGQRLHTARNTSTCVEKTSQRMSRWPDPRKHLHVRGEDPAKKHCALSLPETPPRAWRRRGLSARELAGPGNTSTCVEKTWAHESVVAFGRKHLHVRGEDLLKSGCLIATSETPPRAWRRPHSVLVKSALRRNTSTCVEKTNTPGSQGWAQGKHLHMRGED